MYNRKERRKIERELGITKLLKVAPKEVKDAIIQKRKEEASAMQRAWQEEQEAIARENEVQRYAKRLQFYTEMGHTQQEAEEILQKERLREQERSARKRKTE